MHDEDGGFTEGLPQRKRLRLEGYDYSLAGAYFITINIAEGLPLLGRLRGQRVVLNEVGEMVRDTWRNLPSYYPGVVLDTFVIMPDHIHGIVVLADPKLIKQYNGPARSAAPTRRKDEGSIDEGLEIPQRPIELPTLMRRFKSYTTKRYFEIKEQRPKLRLPAKLWQRSYYERVIRSESDLEEKREYIVNNPLRRSLNMKDK